jgi:hypothetical protein
LVVELKKQMNLNPDLDEWNGLRAQYLIIRLEGIMINSLYSPTFNNQNSIKNRTIAGLGIYATGETKTISAVRQRTSVSQANKRRKHLLLSARS